MTTEELEKKLKISKNTSIHCPTLELAIQTLSIFDQLGLKWCDGTSYITCNSWDRYEEYTVYYPFEGERHYFLEFAHLTGYKVIRAEEFIALHTEEKEFDLENYEPKGQLKGFPKEIIARMLECQEEQGNKIDVSVFEKHRAAEDVDKGFNWFRTKEGSAFWEPILRHKNFAPFFERYPKKEAIKVCSKCKGHKKQEYQKLKQKNNMTTEELEKKLKISKNTCIHCPTLELAKHVLSIFHQLGLKWCNGEYYTSDHNWNSFKEDTVYHPFDGECSSLEFANFTGFKIISAEEFIVLHAKKEKFDLENYIPKGDLIGFPKEIIARMLERQVEQGNKIDVSVFERDNCNSLMKGGFYWYDTKEGSEFWNEVIRNKDFALFFEEYYNKKQETKVCSKCHKEKSLSEFHKKGDRVRSECKECRKQEYQELKNNKNMQENNKKEDNSQKFKVGDKVIDIILNLTGVIINIKSNGNLEIQFEGKCGLAEYNLKIEKRASLLHYRDDYDYDVIDFNNLPKRQEPKRWRAKSGEAYYRFTANFDVGKYYHYNSIIEDRDYASGNYFQTKEEAQEVTDMLKKYFQELLNTIKMMKS